MQQPDFPAFQETQPIQFPQSSQSPQMSQTPPAYAAAPQGYRQRIVDDQIERYMRLFGAVEITGTKWCGKTWTARAHANSITYVDEAGNLAAAHADPSLMLLGDKPHVIDEWQLVPALWDHVRHAVDEGGASSKGSWLLTGSSTPLGEQRPNHTGAGRIGRVRMNPMTLAESGESNATVSLAGLFRGQFQPAASQLSTTQLIDAVCRGGWPETIGMSAPDAQTLTREYLDTTVRNGFPAIGKDPHIARRLLVSLARNVSQAATYSTLLADMYGSESNPEDFVSARTVSEYAQAFADMFVIDEIPGWVPPRRSPKRLRTKPRRYFADPSLAAAALGMGPQALVSDWQTFGLLFENLCIRDLLVYARALPDAAAEPVHYYHDDADLECDAVIELADGRWAGIEIKTSHDKVEQAAKNLLRMRGKLCETPQASRVARVREPEFLAVLIGVGDFAYRRDDGIYVIPIGTLSA